MPGLRIGGRLDALRTLLKSALTRTPDLDRWESERGYPLISNPLLAHDSEAWRDSAVASEISQLARRHQSAPA